MPAKLQVPKPSEIRDAGLRVVRSALIVRGVANPNVTKDSDHFVSWDALAQELATIYANSQVSADQSMPDTAEDEDLVRWLDFFQRAPREAQGSAGPIVLKSSASTFVALAKQLIDSQGSVFEVTTGGTYANNATIPIRGVSTGNATNLPQGTPLQWVGGAPSFSDPIALVGVGGLIGGADTDTNETARNFLYSHVRNPAQAGNWTQIARWALESSASVQAAFVYPALNGPATVGVCIVGPLTFDATNGWSRGVSDDVLAVASSYILARLPDSVRPGTVIVTPKDTGLSTPNVDSTVAIGLNLPLAVAGGGPGGGWVDAVPWPDLIGAATRVYVQTVTDSTHLVLTSNDAANCPTSTNLIAGETEIAWFSPSQFAGGSDPMVTATVTEVSGSTGAISVTLSEPFAGIVAGDVVMPNAENIQAYGRAFLATMNAMGPGQWTNHPVVLVYAKRYPLVTSANPADFVGTQLRAMTDVGSEVLDAAYLYRSTTALGVPVNTTTASPLIQVPFRFGFFNKIP